MLGLGLFSFGYLDGQYATVEFRVDLCFVDRGGGQSVPGGPATFHLERRAVSPEEMQGRAVPDRRSDVYSLGVLAYEVLGGGRPVYEGLRPDFVWPDPA